MATAQWATDGYGDGRTRRPLALRLWLTLGVLLATALLASAVYASNVSSGGVIDGGLVEVGADSGAMAAPSAEFLAAQQPPIAQAVTPTCYSPPAASTEEILEGVTYNISLPAFDTSLGTLISASTSTSMSLRFTGMVEPQPTVTQPITVNADAFVISASMSGPFGQEVMTSNTSFNFGQIGPIAVGSSEPYDVSGAVGSNSTQFTTGLSAFTGGPLNYSATATGFATFVSTAGSTNFILDISSFLIVQAEVEYCYTPPPTSTITISSSIELGGSTGVLTPTANYTVACDNGFSGTASILGTNSTTVDIGVAPAGTTCEVTQTIASPATWSTTANGACGSTATIGPDGTATFANVLAGSPSDIC